MQNASLRSPGQGGPVVSRSGDPPKSGKGPISSSRSGCHERAVVMHYPAHIFVESTSSSSTNLHADSARRTISTPILQASGDTLRRREAPRDGEKPGRTNELPLERSSSFVVTNSELPIIDISSFDYNAYRHKLMQATLRERYENYQPPGDVVLNSIHLNTMDSTLGVRLDDRFEHSFFDFVEEYYDAARWTSKKEKEFLHPLDHFLTKTTQRPETAECGTETNFEATREAERSSPEDAIGLSKGTKSLAERRKLESGFREARVSGARPSCRSALTDESRTDRSRMRVGGRKMEDHLSESRGVALGDATRVVNDSSVSKGTRRASRVPERRPASTGGTAEARKSGLPSNGTSIERRASVPAEIELGPEDLAGEAKNRNGGEEGLSSIEKESTNRTSASSVEAKSIPSKSTKPGDLRHSRESSVISRSRSPGKPLGWLAEGGADKPQERRRSRESSVASRSRSPSKPLPWLAGNPRTSFNRKYGCVERNIPKLRGKTTAEARLSAEKSRVSSVGRYPKAATVEPNSERSRSTGIAPKVRKKVAIGPFEEPKDYPRTNDNAAVLKGKPSREVLNGDRRKRSGKSASPGRTANRRISIDERRNDH
ncbi:hypothetical protein KM043_005439 [Ampulex compressa]|nr:hypothetical protein KM043_005439 [Ampulex compressa]